MDKKQKSTLRSLHIRIADELILDEDFYAVLRRDKIFTNGMLDIIKAEGKPRDRVYKLLELLEKRGPTAFDNFVWILKENYEWLAKELEEQHNIRLQRSQQGREMTEQRSTQYETKPKYLSNDQHNQYDQCLISNNRAISTPNPQKRTSRQAIIPTQESLSAGFCNTDSQQFFPTPGYKTTQIQHQQLQQQHQTGYDCSDNLTITGPTSNDTDLEPKTKQYKDACMSPIGIIESSRNTAPTLCSPTCPQSQANDETQSEVESYDQGFDEIQSQTATATTSTKDEVESQITSTIEEQSEGFEPFSENVDAVDAPIYSDLNENDHDFPTSEVYYDFVKRGSSQLSHFDGEVYDHELCLQDDENDATRSEISYEQSEAFQLEMKEMRALYIKLIAITSKNEDSEDLEDDTVTWAMINSETDKLINRLENSDDTKMIRKCYELFPEKRQRQPLNLCIDGLKKEIEDMVNELWGYQQDISNNKRLKKTLNDKDIEINKLKTLLENLEKDTDIKLKQMEEKNAKIQELENKLQELQCDQQRKPGVTTRRGMYQRRVSNAQGQSPKRQASHLTEPRIYQIHGAYGQQSPRNLATARRAQNRK